ncbi:MAG: circularly permuted type 2 ATP-grasp protein [Verrucomicrobiota bacterium]
MPRKPTASPARSLNGFIIRQTEFGDGSTKPHDFVKPLVDMLRKSGRKQLQQRQARIRNLSRELDTHFTSGQQQSLEEHNWQLDTIPRVINPEEWRHLEAGLLQRAQAFNLLLADVYDKRRIIQDGVIPCELVFDDPTFLLACQGIKQPDHQFITLGAVDLVRSRDGRWQVTTNHYALPYGISFVLQNRRMLSQAFPEVFEPLPIHPVTGFTSELAEVLTSYATTSNPLIVMLTRAGLQNNQFEETFLARRMGVPLVEPGDLLVRNNKVYLKTVGGLERVDVIYRRTNSRGLDPIAFRSAGVLGVPGLLNCVRKGTVKVMNAFGAGIADNKALLPYSDRIIKYYLQEKPLLATAPTFWCRDPDQLDYVKTHIDRMLLKPVHRQRDAGRNYTTGQRQTYVREMRSLLEQHPELVVAQPFIDASQSPSLYKDTVVHRPAYLRAFCLLGNGHDQVLPGGLTRQATSAKSYHYIADLAGGAKDTWIPVADGKAPAATTRKALIRARKRVEQRSFRATSRVAEQLYWMGRYVERSEHTGRMIRILIEFAWGSLSERERRNIWPLWQGAALSTGMTELARKTAPTTDVLSVARTLVLDARKSASIISCAQSALRNGSEIREFITPEVWSTLSRFAAAMDAIPHKSRSSATRLQDACLHVIDATALINGTINRTMPHDDGWECYRIGILLERAISTVNVLNAVIPPTILSYSDEHDQDPDLTSLLRMLGSLDAYQREYRSRTYLRQTIDLLWKNQEIPSSLGFCLFQMLPHLTALEQATKLRGRRSPLNLITKMHKSIESLQTEPLFPKRNIDSDLLESTPLKKIEAMARKAVAISQGYIQQLNHAHELLEDAFFSHLSSTAK